MDAMEKTVEGMKPLVDKGISMAQERFNAAKPALEKGMSMAQQGIDAAKPHVQSALNAAKPHVQSAIDAAKPAVQNAIGAAKPAVKNAFDAAKPNYGLGTRRRILARPDCTNVATCPAIGERGAFGSEAASAVGCTPLCQASTPRAVCTFAVEANTA